LLIKEGDGLYSVNPKFDITSTGRGQAGIFGELVDRFFTKESGIGPIKGAKTKGTFLLDDPKALIDLVNDAARGAKTGRKTIFNVKNDLKLGAFLDNLGSIDVQISGAEFKQLGKLSPELAGYLKGLRQVPLMIEQKMGGSKVATLTKAFNELADNASLLRQGSRIKDPVQIDAILRRLTKADPTPIISTQSTELNSFLQKNLGIDFMKDLKAYKAAQAVKDVQSPLGKTVAERQGLVNIMKNAFSEGNISFLDAVKEVDHFLPTNLRIADHAYTHTVAEALHKNAASLLRGKFMQNALGARMLGGAVGGAGGLLAFMGLQNPGILRALIKASAKMSNMGVRKLVGLPLSGPTRQALRTSPMALRLLKQLTESK
jgi:hypothetical protein